MNYFLRRGRRTFAPFGGFVFRDSVARRFGGTGFEYEESAIEIAARSIDIADLLSCECPSEGAVDAAVAFEIFGP